VGLLLHDAFIKELCALIFSLLDLFVADDVKNSQRRNFFHNIKKKGKVIPLHARCGPEGG
jgi:hypothetical protein